MFQSLKYSNLFLRLGLAFVFIWLGADKFINFQYWFNVWTDKSSLGLISKVGIGLQDLVYARAILELLIGTSILSNIFVKSFSVLAIVILVVELIAFGPIDVSVRNIGLIGGLYELIL